MSVRSWSLRSTEAQPVTRSGAGTVSAGVVPVAPTARLGTPADFTYLIGTSADVMSDPAGIASRPVKPLRSTAASLLLLFAIHLRLLPPAAVSAACAEPPPFTVNGSTFGPVTWVTVWAGCAVRGTAGLVLPVCSWKMVLGGSPPFDGPHSSTRAVSSTVIRLVPPNTNWTPGTGSLRIGLLHAPGMAVPTYSPPIRVLVMFRM